MSTFGTVVVGPGLRVVVVTDFAVVVGAAFTVVGTDGVDVVVTAEEPTPPAIASVVVTTDVAA